MANLDPFDKISDLPDAMIHHILSFLTTKEAVATSVLSKRWLHLWTLVPVLDIEQSPVPHCSDNKIREKIQQKFCHFVSNVFQRNKSASLEIFRLKCYVDASPFGKWIFPATARGLQELDLDVSCSSTKNDFRWKLTTSFFNELRLLKVLKLSNRVRVDISETVSFPKLKILHLVLVEYRDDRSVGILFSGCVVLQELFIKRTPFDYVQSFNISIPTLKTLSIELEGQHDVEINAPALEYLNLKDDMSMSPRNLVRNIPRSIEGVISWSSKRTTQILRAMCSVKSLSLSGNIWCNELIRFGFNRVLKWYGLSGNIFQEQDFSLMFVNLVRLELNVGLFGWIFMPLLLKTSPILQVLVLSVSEAFQVGDEQGSSLPKHVPKCFSSHLETVCFRKFAGLEREVRLIEYILTNARVLKTMTICSDGSFSDSDFLLHKKLSEIPRCSETCQLEFKCQELEAGLCHSSPAASLLTL